jgi:predicted oxidoreductase
LVELSVMHLDAGSNGTLGQCQRLRIAPMAWSPLGGDGLTTIAQIHQATLDQVALAWWLAHPA